MSAHMKERLTSNKLEVMYGEKEIKLSKEAKQLILRMIKPEIEQVTYSAEDTLGVWVNDSRMRVANYLKGARIREGLTQLELCAKVKGLEQSNLSSMENGHRPIPKDLIKKLAKILRIKESMLDEIKNK